MDCTFIVLFWSYWPLKALDTTGHIYTHNYTMLVLHVQHSNIHTANLWFSILPEDILAASETFQNRHHIWPSYPLHTVISHVCGSMKVSICMIHWDPKIIVCTQYNSSWRETRDWCHTNKCIWSMQRSSHSEVPQNDLFLSGKFEWF